MKITWAKLNRAPQGCWYRAQWDDFVNMEKLLDEIAAWCRDNDCGKRMSYDMFKFKNRAQATAFLLRWG